MATLNNRTVHNEMQEPHQQLGYNWQDKGLAYLTEYIVIG